MSNSSIFKAKLMITLTVVLSSLGFLLSGSSAGAVSSITVTDLYNLSNQERSNAGLSTLSLNYKLNSAAYAKANHMIANNYWAHVAPDGTTPWYFINNSGYSYVTAGENLAKGFSTSSGVTTGWMNSPTHRANILNASYKEVGYAVVDGILLGSQTTLVVAMYCDPVVENQITSTVMAEATPTQTPTQSVQSTRATSVVKTEAPARVTIAETTVTITQPNIMVVNPAKTSSKNSVKSSPTSNKTANVINSTLTVIVEAIKNSFKAVADVISSVVPVKEISTFVATAYAKVVG